jgi:arsenate reductase
MQTIESILFPEIKNTIQKLDFNSIAFERKNLLQPLINYIQNKVSNSLEIRLNFICTHNSRRSHLSQIWAQTAASHFNIRNVFCYSGGIEVTALFPMIAITLSQMGFKIEPLSSENNPIYAIKFADNEPPVIGFSKAYDSEFNPKSEFAAIMTCSQADVGCPFIAGADQRIPIPFEDPKMFDNTAEQAQIYLERSAQIATEMFYVFSQIKKN